MAIKDIKLHTLRRIYYDLQCIKRVKNILNIENDTELMKNILLKCPITPDIISEEDFEFILNDYFESREKFSQLLLFDKSYINPKTKEVWIREYGKFNEKLLEQMCDDWKDISDEISSLHLQYIIMDKLLDEKALDSITKMFHLSKDIKTTDEFVKKCRELGYPEDKIEICCKQYYSNKKRV